MQEVVDPQGQAIDQQDCPIMASVDDNMKVRLFFNRCPALCFAIFTVSVDTLLHLNVCHITRARTGGHIGTAACEGFGLLLGVTAFSAPGAAGNKYYSGHIIPSSLSN
jgi:hypothetical protein